MQGVVIVLKTESAEAFARIQDDAVAELGGRLLPAGHIPHMTLHFAEQYDLEKLHRIAQGLARSEPPFAIHTEGVAFFSGPSPLAYWPVVRTARLSLLQRVLAQEAHPAVISGLSEFGDPQRWIPHVTLGTAPDFDAAGRLAAFLLARSPGLEVVVDELVIAEDTPEGTRILGRFKLEG